MLDGVGSTEMLHIFLSNAPDDLEYGTSGVAVPGYDLRLVDETGAEVAPGRPVLSTFAATAARNL